MQAAFLPGSGPFAVLAAPLGGGVLVMEEGPGQPAGGWGSPHARVRDKRPSSGWVHSVSWAGTTKVWSSPMEDKQILCVGLVVLDIINVVDKYPEEDTDSR